MVEFVDGSVLAQLSRTDMGFPIQYALTWPNRVKGNLTPLDFASLAKLEFETPRSDDFPALDLARKAGITGGTLPAVYNAANEVAVARFLRDEIEFLELTDLVEDALAHVEFEPAPDLDGLLEADAAARRRAAAWKPVAVRPS